VHIRYTYDHCIGRRPLTSTPATCSPCSGATPSALLLTCPSRTFSPWPLQVVLPLRHRRRASSDRPPPHLLQPLMEGARISDPLAPPPLSAGISSLYQPGSQPFFFTPASRGTGKLVLLLAIPKVGSPLPRLLIRALLLVAVI